MSIQQLLKRSSIAIALILSLWAPSAFAADAVASIKSIKGYVEVERQHKTIAARVGLILYDNDVILTDRISKVSIIFRDGSIIRLFPKTRFVIEKSEETEKGARKFFHKLILKVGAFWGKFTHKRQETMILTPTATAGIKGTNVAFSQRDDKLTVSLSSGNVSVRNDDELVDLKAGQMIIDARKRGSLNDKVQRLPYRIVIEPRRNEIKQPTATEKVEFVFSLQLMDLKTNQNLHRSGVIHLVSDLDKIEFPDEVKLNNRGFARVTAKISALEPKDLLSDYAEILAVMDSEKSLDVGAGRTVLRFDSKGKKSRTIKIDVKSGTFD